MRVEVEDTDTGDALTPAWHLAKNCGVPIKDIVQTLKARGVPVVLDDELRPAFRKSDLYALMSGQHP